MEVWWREIKIRGDNVRKEFLWLVLSSTEPLKSFQFPKPREHRTQSNEKHKWSLFSSDHLGLGCNFNREAQTALALATSTSSSGGMPGRYQVPKWTNTLQTPFFVSMASNMIVSAQSESSETKISAYICEGTCTVLDDNKVFSQYLTHY